MGYALDKHKQVMVNDRFQIIKPASEFKTPEKPVFFKNIFALGDITNINEEKVQCHSINVLACTSCSVSCAKGCKKYQKDGNVSQ